MQDKPVLSPEQLKVLRELLEQYKPDLLRFAAGAEAANLRFRAVVRAAAPMVGQWLSGAAESMKKVNWAKLAEAHRALSELPDRSKKAMKLAAENGWFFGWNDSLQGIQELIKNLEATGTAPVTADAVDQVFSEYFEENFEAITRDLLHNYAHRVEPINAAVAAHKSDALSGAYLSIPVFIAQADGILSEVVGIKSVFERSGRNKLIEKVAEWGLVDAEVTGLLQPFEELDKLDLLLGRDQRPAAFTALNRHQVMHGESQAYGTRTNSLKAFSLLAFVGLHVPLVLDKVKRAEAAATKAAATAALPVP